MKVFNIDSQSVAHTAAQIRVKQLATRYSQYRVQKSIVEWEEQNQDKSGNEISKEIIEGLEQFYNTSQSINDYLKTQDVNDIGYPIKFNKTNLQIKMALDYAKEQEDNLLGQLKNAIFYNNQYCYVDSTELPILQSDNKTSYWGNENSSVSSVLLESVSTILDADSQALTGAATFYPFYNPEYTLPEELIVENYPFTSEEGMLLSGGYQFGGHRYFKDPLVFGPEDCSSAVGKATGLTNAQVKTINTTQMRENYSNYGYKLVATLNNIDQKQLELIKPGDIYLYKTHCAIIATKPDNYSNITTLQFSRDIDRETQKLLGGGLYDYNLVTKTSEDPNSPVYILRAENSRSVGEEISLLDFLNKVDARYGGLYPEGPTQDIIGDCAMFFEYANQA
ncbi:MAG TPA: hypothetical protein LFW21_05915 [Rickettsia endosymbiont of Pyrocoelia pectoralis]|nr:hypothetical protein [Rickettsia endosymbiont of Pyrocoelia pectoralis]